MRFLPQIFYCSAVTALLAAAGCAATAAISVLQPVEENLSRYKKAVVVVASNPQIQWRDELPSVEARLKFAMMGKLKASKKFSDVTDLPPSQPADSDLKIVVTVASISARPSGGYLGPNIGIGVGGGSGGGFFGLGMGAPFPGAGSTAALTVQVELLDAKTGGRLGYIDASATSGDLSAQAEAIADKVVAEITAKAK